MLDCDKWNGIKVGKGDSKFWGMVVDFRWGDDMGITFWAKVASTKKGMRCEHPW